MTLEADLKALETDAGTWQGVSETLSSASSATWSLDLGISQLSWAAQPTGLDTEYDAFVEHVRGLLDGGTKNTGEIAAALRLVKASYESTDASVRDDYVGLWNPISGS